MNSERKPARLRIRLTTIFIVIFIFSLVAAIIHLEIRDASRENEFAIVADENIRLKQRLKLPTGGFITQLSSGPAYRYSIGRMNRKSDIVLYMWNAAGNSQLMHEKRPPESAKRVTLLTMPHPGTYELMLQFVSFDPPVTDANGDLCHCVLQASYADLIDGDTLAKSDSVLLPIEFRPTYSYMMLNGDLMPHGWTILQLDEKNEHLVVRIEPQ